MTLGATIEEIEAAAPNVINSMLAERGRRYGQFQHHAEISQTLKCVIQNTSGWNRLADDQKEALEMVMHKVARILNGDPNYFDSWRDVAGYSELIAKRLCESPK